MQRGLDEKSGLLFMTLAGEAMPDPRPAIDKNPYRKMDYQACHAATKTFITERWGLRETQEDRVLVDELPDFMYLSSADRQHVLLQTILDLQAEIARRGQAIHVGATLCATVLCGDLIYNANVGDSESFLAVRDKDNALIRFERINKKLHGIHSGNVKSLKKAGFKIISSPMYGYRLMDQNGEPGINMYRAMGDLKFENAGLQHHPDIYNLQVDIPTGGNAFVINACDGLTERLSLGALEQILKKQRHTALKDLPLILSDAALKSGSQDNISVIVTPVDVMANPKCIVVFDGHGGTLVSKFLNEHFPQVLLKNSRAQLFAPLSIDQNAVLLAQMKEVDSSVAALDSATEVAELVAAINHNFYVSLTHEANVEKKAERLVQHWAWMTTLYARKNII